MLSEGWRAIAPRPASAAENPGDARVIAGQIIGLGRELSRVVVNHSNASSYGHAIGQVLDLTARYQLQNDPADDSVSRSWPLLVKATAWQESCWRQFVIKHRRVWYLESPSGDIGLMQINKYVWRGFYNLTRVRWDTIYNVSAGAQILRRFLAESSSHLHSNDPVLVARAAYAAYNGGPAAYDRWRRPGEPPALRAIDQSFWSKYSAIAAGRSFDILSCAADWSRLHAG